jgi:hypothetical protein
VATGGSRRAPHGLGSSPLSDRNHSLAQSRGGASGGNVSAFAPGDPVWYRWTGPERLRRFVPAVFIRESSSRRAIVSVRLRHGGTTEVAIPIENLSRRRLSNVSDIWSSPPRASLEEEGD